MKIVIIHGQSHKGSTYHVAHELAEKTGGEITEFFLPRDFGEFCAGGVIVSIPISILFVIMQKFYVEGITGGSVKG